MLDFLLVSTRSTKRGVIEIYPKFIIKKSNDLMIRGGDFYAIWIEEKGLWSTDENDALQLIDMQLTEYADNNSDKFDANIKIMHMWDAESGMIDAWHKYCQKQMRDNYHNLDEKLIFNNDKLTKKDYASKILSYPLEKGDISAYTRLMDVLYSKEEQKKIDWAIGSIVVGDSRKIQKFIVLYGSAGTGKSTLLNIIQKLFEGYYAVFDARALGSSSNSFALEAFKSNPLVAIQHDGDLSKIEDNTRLNSLVSHELMTVNEKFKTTYSNRFKSFLFMGTNKPVRITDAKSGLIRRLIDVSPTGNTLSVKEYKSLVKQIDFELGAIAYHCKQVYLKNQNAYDDYIPINMLGASNDFYNFIVDSFHIFKSENITTLKTAWEMYKEYCDDAKVGFPYSQRIFKEELKNYFYEYKDRFTLNDGTRVRSYYEGFRSEKFSNEKKEEEEYAKLIEFKQQKSIFDTAYADCKAQYANEAQKPIFKWDSTETKLKDIDTSKVHYVRLPINHIVIDFDLCDENGNKSYEKNIEEASKWPPTYAELSKSADGIHLHYIYTGDTNALSRTYSPNIEVKVFSGKSSLRRKLSKCNSLEIAKLSSGLALKEDNKILNEKMFKTEKSLRAAINKNLNKEVHPNTKPSIDFIKKILDDAYNSDLVYDLSDMRGAVFLFAASSTNQAEYCTKLVNTMQFKSKCDEDFKDGKAPLAFFDVEVFPNLFVICWKLEGEDKKIVRMINPKPHEIEDLIQYRLIGFNCRRYDNHILYAALLGYSNEQLFKTSQAIINNKANAYFAKAYNISYTDVYDFSSVKQSLKKFEIELGIPHKELGMAWDKDVPEDMWTKVAEYCDNDVLATEAVFKARSSDFLARQILAQLANKSVNDTTNSLTTSIIFGNDKEPQKYFNYRNMGDKSLIHHDFDNIYNSFDANNKPIFPDYVFDCGKSTYRGEEVGEGGYVYAQPGIYTNVCVLDIASMHPSSIVAENLFGDAYTKKFKDIMDARLAIKHKDFEKASAMLLGKLAPYLKDQSKAKDLSYALKIAINSVYGLTSAKFKNSFRDDRNIDNIVAKRGALFMINLKHEVQKRGYTVAHIKTDSIKIPNATQDIIDFVYEYGLKYDYSFEHETTYSKMCLVNDAVYIAKDDNGWTAVGAQFAVPYVFKKLFSKEELIFSDLCETKAVSTAIYLDFNENLTQDEHNYKFIGKVGLFCPIMPGCGGGILLRQSEDKKTGDVKYDAVSGSKGYRWMESDIIKTSCLQDCIDYAYYNKMLDDAVQAISKYGDIEIFTS